MGRKKMVIRRIEHKAARDVCFSKRRNGLFTKANELAVMCGAEVVAVVHSPASNAYSFAHPSAEDVINRFLPAPQQAGAAAAPGTGAAVDWDRLEALQQEYNKLCAEQAAVEERKGHWGKATAKGRAEGSQAAAWLDAVADRRGMGDADMLACMAKLREAQHTVAAGVNQVLEDGRRANQAALAALLPQLIAGGGGFEVGGTSANGGMDNFQQQQMMMSALPQLPGHAGGYGFEFGGTSADGGMYEQQMTMPAMPPPTGFAAGMEMQQQQQMMSAMPTPPGFAPGMEMQQQQQQTLTALAPLPAFAAGTETTHQVFGQYASFFNWED